MKEILRNNVKSWIILLLVVLVSVSCSKEASQDVIPLSQNVSFGFNIDENAGRIDADENPVSVRITIEGLDGEIFHEGLLLDLFAFGNSYVSESVKLIPNKYQLTEFQILNESDQIIYASPIKGSAKAPLVDEPLPIMFEVIQGESTKLSPEVLPVEEDDSPSDFGYLVFGFEVVDNFILNLDLLSDWDSSHVAASWTFTSFREDSTEIEEVEILYQEGSVENVRLSKDAHFYRVEVSQTNYHTVVHYFETSYLENLEILPFSISPSDLFEKFTASAPSFGLNNLAFYVPRNGCLAYGRVDVAGLASMDTEGGYYLFLNRSILDLDQAENLLINIVEAFGPNLVYTSGYNASEAPDECSQLPNSTLEIRLEVLADIAEDFAFITAVWNSTNEQWQVELPLEDLNQDTGR